MGIDGISRQPGPMDALMASGDVGAEVAALAVKSGVEERRVDQTERDALEQCAEDQEAQEVAAMRDKADQIRDQGFLEAGGMAASGAASFASAFCTQSTALRLQSGGTVVAAIAKGAAAMYAGTGASDDANAAEHRDAAGRADVDAKDAQADSKAAEDYVSAALDFYRGYVSTESQTMNAALHRA